MAVKRPIFMTAKRPARSLASEMKKNGNPKISRLIALVERQEYQSVIDLASEVLKRAPADPYALKALSFGLIGTGRYADALRILDRAVRVSPGDPELHNNLGICLSAEMRWAESIRHFDRAIAMTPADPELWKNKGAAFSMMHKWHDALPCFAKAIELHPGDYDDAFISMASAFLNAGKDVEAHACYSALYEENPDNAFFLACLLRAALRICDWTDFSGRVEKLRDLSKNFRRSEFAPFFALAFPSITQSEIFDLTRSKYNSRISEAFEKSRHRSPVEFRKDVQAARIRIGYVSFDFRDHPVGHVLPRVLELHDRERFEVFGYSLGPNDGSPIRDRLVRAFDHFRDISEYGPSESHEAIVGDGIDILVDLQGWTAGERMEIFAMRSAPIQVNWMGYAGTLGDRRLADYLIADPVVLPEELEPYFSEQIVRLPHCYLPMDPSLQPDDPPSRDSQGLPAEGIVLCSHNNSYKINPLVWDSWCRILQRVPTACLWLSRPQGDGDERLRMEAKARGVDPARIVFATRVASRQEHLGRLGLADLALDPFPYNSHSSGIDVLWAGVPMVSLLGTTFAGRVGASVLNASGMSGCIVHSLPEYEDLTVALCSDPGRLATLRAMLRENKTSAPLFDMARFVQSLEAAYISMKDQCDARLQ